MIIDRTHSSSGALAIIKHPTPGKGAFINKIEKNRKMIHFDHFKALSKYNLFTDKVFA